MNKKILATLTLSAIMTLSGSAQSRILPILEANPDVRSAAMGNAMLGNVNQMYIYANPAALVFDKHTFSIDAGTEVYPKAEEGRLMQYNLAAGYKFTERAAVLMGMRYQNGVTVNSLGDKASARIRPHEMTLDLGYAFAVTDDVAVYATATYAKDHAATSADVWAFSFGAAYQKPFKLTETVPTQLTVGVRLMDFGKAVKYNGTGLSYGLPTSVVAGGDWGVDFASRHKLTYALSCRYFTTKDAHETLLATGLEYTYNKLLSARVGYQDAKHASNMLTFGVGGEYGGFKLNASYSHSFRFYGIDTFQASLGYSF